MTDTSHVSLNSLTLRIGRKTLVISGGDCLLG